MQLPNFLTLMRIIMLIPFVGLFYVNSRWANWGTVIIFLSACITDYFDGYFARSLNKMSAFGRFLDPVADKLLVATTLLMLAGTGRLSGLSLLPAGVILCREILVSGLREFLAELSVRLPVSKLAKWKTAFQMAALCCLLYEDPDLDLWKWEEIGLTALWAAAFLTLITGYDYLRAALKYMPFED
jgi:cardiolipin synthase